MKSEFKWCWGVLLMAALLLPSPASAALVLGQIDDFEDGTTQGWIINLLGMGAPPSETLPTNIADGGPAGAGDNFLQLTALGNPFSGGRLTVINTSQWAGDYLAAGITAIEMDVRNAGNTDVLLRLLVADPIAGPPSNVAVSTLPVLVPAGGDWTHVLFPIAPSNLTSLLGSATGALSNATELRLYHSAALNFPGDPIVAVLHVDNIQASQASSAAVPEPSTGLIAIAGMVLFFSGKMVSRHRRR